MKSQIAIFGLGTMGKALAKNLLSRNFKVSVWNRTHSKVLAFASEVNSQNLYAPESIEDFLDNLEKPRKIILMVDAGEASYDTIKLLSLHLNEGDIVINGANEHFKATQLHEQILSEKNIRFLNMGISGGEEGALKGPSMMLGGNLSAWHKMEDFLKAASADDFSGKACVAYFGEKYLGHYVKMVHNGIEYAEMQALAEAYDILKKPYKLSNDAIADIFENWKNSELDSFLLDCCVDVLRQKEQGVSLLDLIVDKSGQKGTGTWTSQEAVRLGVPAFNIVNALFARGVSSRITQRESLSKIYEQDILSPNELLHELSESLRHALIASRMVNFINGFEILQGINKELEIDLNFAEVARVWQGGCIIRSKSLKDFYDFFQENDVEHIMHADFVVNIFKNARTHIKKVVNFATNVSVSACVIYGTFNYFESMVRTRSSANLIQGMRDRFGSHGYEKTNEEGTFHTRWFFE